MKSGLLAVLISIAGCSTGTLGVNPTGDANDGDSNGDALAGDPAAGDSAAGDPAAGDPAAGDPAAGDPTAGDPIPGDPIPGDTYTAQPQSCAEKSAEIVANTGNTILVSPAGPGEVTVGGNPTTLRQVINGASPGDTILLADGTYTFRESTASDDFTGLYFVNEPNITMRGQSGDPSAVILDSNYFAHGGMSAVITVAASGIVIADLTVQRSISHLIHFQSNGDNGVVHNVHLIDGGQQFMKASGTNIDSVEVSCSRFVMTAAGRDNVWGYGSCAIWDFDANAHCPTDTYNCDDCAGDCESAVACGPAGGGTDCYTGGIDTHDSRDWHVHDNYFEGIYCDATGVERPAHGKDPSDERRGQTYTGGLAEHAIHMWDATDGHGHVIERNRIVNCARGIGIGMATDVYDTMVRNNTVFSGFAGNSLREHDVGINIDRGHDIQVFNNTVFFSSPDAYGNAIESRWDVTSGVEVRNNLVNQAIALRNDAGAGTTLSNNVTNAQAGWFVDAAAGDLHLNACDIGAVDGAGIALGAVTDDIDQDARPDHDIGADQCQ